MHKLISNEISHWVVFRGMFACMNFQHAHTHIGKTVLSVNEHDVSASLLFLSRILFGLPPLHIFCIKIANPLKPLQSEISINVISTGVGKESTKFPHLFVKLYVKIPVICENVLPANILRTEYF